MASFSTSRRWAYHVVPLHFLPRLRSEGALLAKSVLGARPMRATTAEVDRALGFADYVHLYLPRRGTSPSALPLVGAQLGPSEAPPVPHVVLRLDTTPLADEHLVVCNWNIAVSAPRVEGGHAGGNWTRGVDAATIAKNWQLFRAAIPDRIRARGYFHDFAVPVLLGNEIADNLDLITHDCTELLVVERLSVARFETLFVFSEFDRNSATLVENLAMRVELIELDGYAGERDLVGPRRKLIDDHLRGNAKEPSFNFDARRPRKKTR